MQSSQPNTPRNSQPRMTVQLTNRIRQKQIPKLKIVFGSGLILLLLLLIHLQIGNWNHAQAETKMKSYRTIASGTWEDPGVWQVFQDEHWITAKASPDFTSGSIEIRASHEVSVIRDLKVDQVMVDPGGTLQIVSGKLTIANADGTDLRIKGTLDIGGQIELSERSGIDITGISILRSTGIIIRKEQSILQLSGKIIDEGGTMPHTPGFIVQSSTGTMEHPEHGRSEKNATVVQNPVHEKSGHANPGVSIQVNEKNARQAADLIGFDASVKSDAVQVTWKSWQEDKVRSYTIERSMDGIDYKSFMHVNVTRGNSTHRDYQFNDEQPLMGNSYYRVRQLDQDGLVSYTSPVVVRFSGLAVNGKFINIDDVIVNPNGGAIYTTFSSRKNQELEASLMSLEGKLLHQESIPVNDGYNSFVYYPNSSLTTGFYLLRLSCAEGSTTRKVFIP